MTDPEAVAQARLAELASALAHELKNPVAAIAGFAELLVARDDETTRREASAFILEASRTLAARIDELLAVEDA